MREAFLLDTAYKNDRSYVHSSDIYHQVIELLHNKGIYPEDFELIFRNVQKTKPLVVISDRQNDSEKEKLCSSISFICNGKNYVGFVFESGQKVERRIFQEDRLKDHQIKISEDLEKATISNTGGSSVIDVLIKVTKEAICFFCGDEKLQFYMRKIKLNKAVHQFEGNEITVIQRKNFKQQFFEYNILVHQKNFGTISCMVRK
jgi:hypothetical protein